MKILTIVLILLASTAYGQEAVYLVCDPQAGVERYEIEVPSIPVTITVYAQADGALAYDLTKWEHGPGWFDANVKAGYSYEVLDVATDVTTRVVKLSPPAAVKIKIPEAISAAGFKVQE